MNVLVYIFITAIIIYLNFIYSHLNSGFKQKLLMVRKILLVEMGRSFANYLCGARILLNKIMHVSGVSRSNINCETEAEVVFIGTIIAPEKNLGFLLLLLLSLFAFFLELIERGLLVSPYFGCLTVIRGWQSGRAVPAPLTAPCPTSPQAGLARIWGVAPRTGKQNLPGCWFSWFFKIIFYLLFLFFPACSSSAQRCPSSVALGPASSLLLCALPNACQPQKLT